MIPRSTQSGVQPSRSTANICLVMGITPASRWENVLPLLERAGFAVPEHALMQRWISAVRDATLTERPGIVTLKPTPLNAALRAATDTIFEANTPPVLIALDGDDAEALASFQDRGIPATRMLLLHSRPERALVEAMRNGADPAAMLERWVHASERALYFYRHNRARVSLIDVDCALATPAEFLEFCARTFGIRFGQMLPEPIVASPDQADVTQLIAAQMVAQSSEVRQLLSELEACSLSIGDPSEPAYVDCTAVFREQQLQTARFDEIANEYERIRAERDTVQAALHERETVLEHLNGQFAEYRKDNELLLLQLHQVQEELESVFQDRKRLGESDAARQAECEQLKSRIAELGAARETQERRIAELSDDRDAKVKEFEERIAKIGKDRSEQAALADSRAAELDRLRLAVDSADARNSEVRQENELLLLQLHQVQEELESYYLQFQSTSVRLKQIDEELEITNGRLTKVSDKLRKSDEMLSLANRRIGYRERRIQYLQNSRSWKITAPVRAVFGLFRRSAQGEGEAS